jgi:hypothetical protein
MEMMEMEMERMEMEREMEKKMERRVVNRRGYIHYMKVVLRNFRPI